MSTYTILEGELGYSFVNVDAVYDFLVSQGMAPYVELSFMPEGLATGNATIMHYKGNITPPQTLQKWYGLIHTFVQHMVTRYGVDEVRKWRFECWNEPNGAFWTGTQQQYFALFNATAAAIKAVDSQLQIGGPATEQSGWVPDLLEYCQAHNVPVDFISTHQYPTVPTYDGKVRDVMHAAVSKVQSQMAAAGAASVPLVYSEYNDGLWRGTPVGPLHDTIYASAFIAFAVPSVVPLNIAAMSWWTFTDIFEEQGQLPAEFSGMWGLQTVNGVPKPSYRAFELLHRLGSDSLPCTASSSDGETISCFAAVTTDASGTAHAQILLSNYQVRGCGDVRTRRRGVTPRCTLVRCEPQVPQVPNTNKTAVVQVPGARDPATATITRIDTTHANAYQAWLAMGSPVYPTRSQIQALLAASVLVDSPLAADAVAPTATTAGPASSAFTVELEPSGVALLDVVLA